MAKEPKQHPSSHEAVGRTWPKRRGAAGQIRHRPGGGARSRECRAKDRPLRALAEVENVRRRATRDVEATRQYAVTAFAGDLLTVADNLERALANAPEAVRDTAGAFTTASA